jgi:hypothetical protein
MSELFNVISSLVAKGWRRDDADVTHPAGRPSPRPARRMSCWESLITPLISRGLRPSW